MSRISFNLHCKRGESIWNRSLAFLRIFCAILLRYDIILLLNVLGFYKSYKFTDEGWIVSLKMSRIHTRQKPLSYCFSKRNV